MRNRESDFNQESSFYRRSIPLVTMAEVSAPPAMTRERYEYLLMRTKMVPNTAIGGCDWTKAGCQAIAAFKATKPRFSKACFLSEFSDLEIEIFQKYPSAD